MYSLPYQIVSNDLFLLTLITFYMYIKENILGLGGDISVHLYTQQPLPVTSERLPLSSSSASVFDGHF